MPGGRCGTTEEAITSGPPANESRRTVNGTIVTLNIGMLAMA